MAYRGSQPQEPTAKLAIDFPYSLKQKIIERAEKEGKTIKQVIIEALKLYGIE